MTSEAMLRALRLLVVVVAWGVAILAFTAAACPGQDAWREWREVGR